MSILAGHDKCTQHTEKVDWGSGGHLKPPVGSRGNTPVGGSEDELKKKLKSG